MLKTLFRAAACGALALTTACATQQVTITYRPVAKFIGFNDMTDNSGGVPAFAGDGMMWVYYRVEQIDNTGEGATKPFHIDYSRFFIDNSNGKTTISAPNASNLAGMVNTQPFHQSIADVPPHQAKTFGAGEDPAPRLFVWQTQSTNLDALQYRTNQGEPRVIVVIDKNAPPPFSPDPAPMTNLLVASMK